MCHFGANQALQLTTLFNVQGASTVLYAALSPELLEDRDALYLHACQVVQPSRLAQERGLAKKLWDASESTVGL